MRKPKKKDNTTIAENKVRNNPAKNNVARAKKGSNIPKKNPPKNKLKPVILDPEIENKRSRLLIANSVYIIILIASFAIAVFAYRLHYTANTKEQYKDTAATAQNTFEETKYNKSLQADESKNNESPNAKSTKKDKSVAKTIIKSDVALQPSENENDPNLQIMVNTAIAKTGTQTFNYSVYNLGQAPIKILKSDVRFYTDEATPELSKEKPDNFAVDNKKITEDSPMYGTLTFRKSLSEDEVKDINYKRNFMYLSGGITYKNLLTNKNKLYEYKIKVTFFGDGNIYNDFIYNENKGAKETLTKN
jgi:hypothetical protein